MPLFTMYYFLEQSYNNMGKMPFFSALPPDTVVAQLRIFLKNMGKKYWRMRGKGCTRGKHKWNRYRSGQTTGPGF